MFKIIKLVILFDKFLNPSCKMTANFAKIAINTASASKFIHYERFQLSDIGFLYKKQFYMRQTLVNMLKSVLREKLNFCF